MTKKTRDFLFGTFVFLFVVITITLSLYATGYRFNLTWPLKLNLMLVKTGTLALDSDPHGATVLITSETKISSVFSFNSKKSKITPIKIKNLLPGEYTVSFTLENYWPFEKKLNVNPEQTTFLENVILFKKSLPLNIFSSKTQAISYSPNGNYAWLKDSGEIINLKTEQAATKVSAAKLNWVGSKQLLAGSKLLTLDNNSSYDYNSLIGEADEAKMSENGDFLIYLSKNNLAAFNFSSKSTTIVPASGQILSYGTSGNILFLVISEKNKTELKSFDLINKNFIASADLLNSKNFSINQDNNKNLILTDNEHKIIYLLASDNSNSIIRDVLRGATVFKWIDGNKLAYTSESEVYIYDLSQSKSYLITRLSEKINSLAWSPNNYLIYATDNNIGTINLTNSGNDITILWRGNNLSSLYLDGKNSILYFSGAIGQQSGLYKLALQ
ncbi:MAG: PEGA domain-containing protein [Candidatus Falkowbacteria bacterium]